ncbi:MAG: glycerophosphodiester phosphodiesterase, partial [Lachnospiraceae bacterium]|nr:glycerophosphodiester phosphodiesterase [Lachnospiraceae bacterium]
DGQIIVMHDTNFMRTAGIDQNTWEMDYDNMKLLDVGSSFSSEFEGEHVPLLVEVVDFAKNNGIKLNIEMKPTGYEQEFEPKVAEIIEQKRFWDQCVITSQAYDVLENVKLCDSRIQTVYVMSIAYGDINRLSAADHFSVEASNITEKMVSDVHNAGKEIYAWIVNTEESINRMIDLNVDNIITDHVTLAKECIYLSKTSDVVSEYVKWLSK